MPYRRPPQNTKRFLPPLLPFYGGQKKTEAPLFSPAGTYKDLLDIPMPNELEQPSGFSAERGILRGLNTAIGFLREHIQIEELILIGIIILLLGEAMEDNLLLILLIYILLF